VTVAIEVLGIQDLPDGPGPLADEDRGKGLVWDGARFVAEVAAPGGAAQVHVARGRGKTRIQEAPDGPGTLGASDDDKVQVWDNSAGRFVMRSAYVELALDEGNTAAENTALLESAISGGDARLLLPAGTFAIDNLVFSDGDVIIRGAGMPEPNAARTALAGGTILQGGTINLNNKTNIALVDLGVDVSAVSTRNAISSGTSDDVQVDQHVLVLNVCTLGDGTKHGCVLTSGDRNTVHNFRAHSHEHGLVLRCSYSTANQVYAEDCSVSAVTVKAAEDFDSLHCAVTNVVAHGTTANAQGPVVISAHDGQLSEHHVLSNITLENVTRGLWIKTVDNGGGSGHGEVRHCSISGVLVDAVQYEGVLVDGETVEYLAINDVSVYGSPTYICRNIATATQALRLVSCWSNTTGAKVAGDFDFEQINGWTKAPQVQNAPLINMYGDSGRFGGELNPFTRDISASFVTNPFLVPQNSSSALSDQNTTPASMKFINNNSTYGGSNGALVSEVDLLIQAMGRTGNNAKFGDEWYVARTTMGSGTSVSYESHYLLFGADSDLTAQSGANAWVTYAFWMRAVSGTSALVQNYEGVYQDGVEIVDDYVQLDAPSDWTHFCVNFYIPRGTGIVTPGIFAINGTVVDIALPAMIPGQVRIDPHSAPIRTLNPGRVPWTALNSYTQAYSTADRTISAYTADSESSTYTGIDNAQGGSVYAQLADLNALRTAYENLRALAEDTTQALNAVIDDLQSKDIVA